MSPSLQASLDFKQIETSSISLPENFPEIFNEQNIAPLQHKILQRFGQTHPLLLRQVTENKYHLLAGYSYFLTLKALKFYSVVGQILPPAASLSRCLTLQTVHNLQNHELSPLIQGYILQQAQNYLSEDMVLMLLSIMGYKPHPYLAQELVNLLQLDQSALSCLHTGLLSFKSGKNLARFSPSDQQRLVGIISTYRLGGSKQQKFIEMIMDLTMQTDLSVQDILQGWDGEQIKDAQNGPQGTTSLFEYLYKKCFPGLAAAESDYATFIKTLQPPERLSVDHSISFEDESLEVRLRFADAAALMKQWDRILSLL